MRPMLDIPRTLSSQGVSSTAIAQAVYIHIILLTIACLLPQLPCTLIENFKIIYASPELINLGNHNKDNNTHHQSEIK